MSTVENRTSFPEKTGTKGILKRVSLNDTDTFPNSIWVPTRGNKIVVDDILASVREASAKRALFDLQIMKGTRWATIMEISQVGNGAVSNNHAFAGKVASDKGDGSTAMIRVTKLAPSNSTNFTLKIAIVGRLV